MALVPKEAPGALGLMLPPPPRPKRPVTVLEEDHWTSRIEQVWARRAVWSLAEGPCGASA